MKFINAEKFICRKNWKGIDFQRRWFIRYRLVTRFTSKIRFFKEYRIDEKRRAILKYLTGFLNRVKKNRETLTKTQ